MGFNVPIYGLTGDDVRTNPQLEEDAKKVGMNKVLPKPIDMMTLMQIVNSHN